MRHSIKHTFRKVLPVVRHEVHKHPFIKFGVIFIILLSYTIFTSVKFGARDGIIVSTLTWSFFVLCTPIADAGFLLDLPIRLLSGIRMVYSEMAVWVVAITINAFVFFVNPALYQDTVILSLFSHILSQPWPYWSIIFLSGIGTFLSIVFSDEIIDVGLQLKDARLHHESHSTKHHFILILFVIILVLILYDFLLHSLGVNIPLL